ncbi:MAG: carboxypeptidase regulatory-like domain-containing protein [Planctomycetes bacterium]|nr:carboxypeptidase regulatory-like domain-containing protein [Planctomycetota bacterium]
MNDRRRPGDSPLERNLRGLLQRAYRPIEASPRFREELRARLLEEADRVRIDAVRRRRARTLRFAAAAAIVLAAGAAIYFVAASGRPRPSPGNDRVAQHTPESVDVETFADARTLDVGAGRLELSAQSWVGVRETDDSAWSIDLRRGEARLHHDGVTGLASLKLEQVELAPVSGRGRFDVWIARTREGETMKWNRVLIPTGVVAGGLIVYLAVHDGAVEMRTPRGREVVLPSEAASSVAGRAPERQTQGETASASVSPPASTRGTLSGLVRVASGRGIAGATVEVGRIEGGAFVASPDPGTCNAAGEFTVRVEPGTWRLRASADGYATRLGDDVRVDAGASVEGLVLELEAGSTIAGRVLDDAGDPIEGALVEASLQDPNATVRGVSSATTDRSGSFIVNGLAEDGIYAIHASKTDHATASTLNVRSHATGVDLTLDRLAGIAGRVAADEDLSPISAFRVTVQREMTSYNPPKPVSQDVQSTDGSFRFLGLEPGTYCLFASAPGFATREMKTIDVSPAHVTEGVLARLEKGGTVRGRVVVRGTGQPIGGAVVYSTRDLPPRAFEEASSAAPSESGDYRAVTGPDGTFELPHLSEGTHSIAAQHAEFAPDRTIAVEVKAGALINDVTLQLSGGGSIAGTATDDKDAPVEGAIIFTIELGRDPRESFTRSTKTDAAGHYSMPRLMPSHYLVGSLPNDNSQSYDVQKSTSATVIDGQTTTVDFRSAPSGSRLFGTITDSKGKPVPQIFVTAVRVGGSSRAVGDIQFKQGMSNADGQYEVKDLKSGTYSIYLQKGITMSFVWVGFVPIGTTGDDIHKDYPFSDSTISGVARDATTGAPLGTATVIINATVPGVPNPFFAGRTSTDPSNGAFRFTGLVPGRYSLVVMAPGYGQETIDKLELTTDQTVSDLDLRLSRGGSLLIRTVDGDGHPAGGVLVIVQDAKGVSVADMSSIPKTNPSGEYGVPGLKPGHYSVRAFLTGAAPVVQGVDVSPGEQAVMTITVTMDASTEAPATPR